MYRPANLKDCLVVINNLRPEDKAEVEDIGQLSDVPFGALASEHFTYFEFGGAPAGIAGIVRLSPTEGQIWMLCTPQISAKPLAFVRQAKEWLSSVEREYKLLWNYADARNHVHHKLLKHLGFKAINSAPIGPNSTPYYEIVKLCVAQ